VIFVNKKILYWIIGVMVVLAVLVVGTLYLLENNFSATTRGTTTKQTTPTPTPSVKQSSSSSTVGLNPAAHSFSYPGQDSKTALELLQQKYPNTQVSGTGASAFITATNGYTADTSKHEFWKFMINGQDSQVGAGSYTTKSTDTITWMIDTY
jgi:hypothetical protein